MDEEKARETASQILGEFERLLLAKDVVIPSDDREGVPGEARLYGEGRTHLQEVIVGLLLEHADVTTTDQDFEDASHPLRELAIAIVDEFEELLAEKGIMIPSKDREGGEAEACLYSTE